MKEKHVWYGNTSYHVAANMHSKGGGYAFTVCYRLKDLGLKDRPAELEKMIDYAVRHEDDQAVVWLLPVYERAIVDAGWADILTLEEHLREPDRYSYPAAEYPGLHPLSGEMPEVIDKMVSLYRRLPHSSYKGSTRTIDMPETKRAIVEMLMRYWGHRISDSARAMIGLLFERSDCAEFLEKEFEIWDAAFRNHRNSKSHEVLADLTMILFSWGPGNRSRSCYREKLIRTAVAGWVLKVSLEQIKAALGALELKLAHTV